METLNVSEWVDVFRLVEDSPSLSLRLLPPGVELVWAEKLNKIVGSFSEALQLDRIKMTENVLVT